MPCIHFISKYSIESVDGWTDGRTDENERDGQRTGDARLLAFNELFPLGQNYLQDF